MIFIAKYREKKQQEISVFTHLIFVRRQIQEKRAKNGLQISARCGCDKNQPVHLVLYKRVEWNIRC